MPYPNHSYDRSPREFTVCHFAGDGKTLKGYRASGYTADLLPERELGFGKPQDYVSCTHDHSLLTGLAVRGRVSDIYTYHVPHLWALPHVLVLLLCPFTLSAGCVPLWLGNLHALETLNLSYNELSGEDDQLWYQHGMQSCASHTRATFVGLDRMVARI